MEIKVWYLKTCSTCQRILKELGLNEDNAELINIKETALTEDEIDLFYSFTGSYKALINGRSMQFRQRGIKSSDIDEDKARELLLDHYAFLKRPVIQVDDQLFVGNSKNVVNQLKEVLK